MSNTADDWIAEMLVGYRINLEHNKPAEAYETAAAEIRRRIVGAEKNAMLEGVEMGANEVGSLVKNLVEDYDQLGSKIRATTEARLKQTGKDTNGLT